MSTICSRFSQNAWKKDLCSNCFKSKEEHKSTTAMRKMPVTTANPPKGIMKSRSKKSRKGKVSFPKELSEVIGFGGDWSDNDDPSSESENEISQPTPEDITKEIDELEQELIHLTKVNTDFNMSNGNLLGDPETNIKRTFAALKLGTPQKGSDGKKQTLKISVTPFGGQVITNKVNNIKQKFNVAEEPKGPIVLKTIIKTSSSDSGESSPRDSTSEEERPCEKSLMDEISETLAKNQELKADLSKNLKESENTIKLEVNKPIHQENTKRSISRHPPIVKDQAKPKINVFPKFSDTDSNTSDVENGTSGYYDVVEAANSYENIPDGYNNRSSVNSGSDSNGTVEIRNQNKSSFFSNHLISEMFSTNKNKNSQSYNFMSKITSDGLIVTKASSDDAMDSTGSSFDYGTSSDEEMSSMNRSESDSGIGICITSNDFKDEKKPKDASNTDYEDIQVQNQLSNEQKFLLDKSRELAGEPDGSADPDGSNEAPALPSSPPPLSSEPRKSFLHNGITKGSNEKPVLPAKPTVSIIKAFAKKSPHSAEQQVIAQLQQIMRPPNSDESQLKNESVQLLQKQDSADSTSKGIKKSRAPDPPSPSSDETPPDYSKNLKKQSDDNKTDKTMLIIKADSPRKSKTDDQYPYLYTRNPTGSISKSTSPVIREKDKRERATINPKFRSLNTFSSQYKNQAQKNRPTTPEPAPRNMLSLSQDSLLEDKKKKNKFSIKKFLRMGSNKPNEPIYEKKENIYSKTPEVEANTPQTKPRLVIIHPIDINTREVEVVKELGKVSEIVTGKPPAPPLRKGLDVSKPIRPPPPKSAELRKKQKAVTNVEYIPPQNKEDNVYANLGEIRSAIAPRKPERTASMREREAQLEMARKRISRKDTDDRDAQSLQSTLERDSTKSTDSRSDSRTESRTESRTDSRMDNRQDTVEFGKVSSRLELFERTISDRQSKQSLISDGIKNSIQKMNNTIDSYLKDRMAHSESEPTILKANLTTSTPVRQSEVDIRNNYEPIVMNTQRSSLPDNTQIYAARDSIISDRMSYSKSEYGAPRYQSHSLANIVRSVTRSYCGSEISESDLYSPYSFYGSEAGLDVAQGDIHDGWTHHQQSKNRPTNRLRMRKGRSVVHKNIEDNYGAVVVANHEALAQVLDQIQKTTTIPIPLRPLANSINLRFEDFTIVEGVRGVVAGRRAFHPAIWANQFHVTLALSSDCNQMSDLSPVTEFCDLVPNHYLPLMPSTELRLVQATISVLPRMLVDTLQSFGQMLKIRSENLKNQAFSGSTINLSEPQQTILRTGQSVQNLSTYHSESTDLDIDGTMPQIPGMPTYDDLLCREVGFVMLQLVNGLKNLQAKGIEELPLSLSNVILFKDLENKEAQARLSVLHGLNQDTIHEEDEPMGTLCQCAHNALTTMLPNVKLTSVLSEILVKDRSESMSKAKSVLEYALWGPSDVSLNGSSKEREMALQRWLDLERATILHGLVRSRVELTAYDECHLMFLVRSSAKNMCEASAILGGSIELAE